MTKHCQCGRPVSDSFHRVFSDNDGTLHACTECARDNSIGATSAPYNPDADGYSGRTS